MTSHPLRSFLSGTAMSPTQVLMALHARVLDMTEDIDNIPAVTQAGHELFDGLSALERSGDLFPAVTEDMKKMKEAFDCHTRHYAGSFIAARIVEKMMEQWLRDSPEEKQALQEKFSQWTEFLKIGCKNLFILDSKLKQTDNVKKLYGIIDVETLLLELALVIPPEKRPGKLFLKFSVDKNTRRISLDPDQIIPARLTALAKRFYEENVLF